MNIFLNTLCREPPHSKFICLLHLRRAWPEGGGRTGGRVKRPEITMEGGGEAKESSKSASAKSKSKSTRCVSVCFCLV